MENPGLDYRIIYEIKGQICFFEIEGELRHSALEPMDSSFKRLVDQGILHFVVDLSQVHLILSCHYGVFLTVLARIWKNGGDIKLVSPSEKQRANMVQMGLDEIIGVFETRDQALLSVVNKESKIREYLDKKERVW